MADNPGRQITPIDQIRSDLDRMDSQFLMVLRNQDEVQMFKRVLLTAIQNNRKLLNCRRDSLLNAAMRAAQDGLLPDGREGVIVPYGDKDEDQGGRASDTASWQPMVAGYRKRARNSGEIADLNAQIVYEGDEFDFQLGDEPRIHHKPSLQPNGVHPKVIAAYSIATFKDGTKSREVMSIEQIEEVRQHYSRAKRGPWSDPVAYPEMCKKTVVKRHCKQLPMSYDFIEMDKRDDDENYELRSMRRETSPERPKRGRPASTRAALDHFAGDSNPGDEPEQTEAGLGDGQPALDVQETAKESTQVQAPKTPEAYFGYARATITRMNDPTVAKRWFNEDGQRRMRKDIGIPVDDTLKFVEEVFGK